jgi:hypothetical protein
VEEHPEIGFIRTGVCTRFFAELWGDWTNLVRERVVGESHGKPMVIEAIFL